MKAVFPESSLNPKLAQAIARETGASADYTLYGDTLGPPGSPGATYLTMERANADAMVRGFTGGSAGLPIRGDLMSAERPRRGAAACAAGYGGGAAASLRGRELPASAPASASACSAPTAAARPRCSGCCSASCARSTAR